MSDENVEALAALLAAFNSGDLETAERFTHPDLTYTIRGRGPLAGTYHGVDAVVVVLGAIRAATTTATADVRTIGRAAPPPKALERGRYRPSDNVQHPLISA